MALLKSDVPIREVVTTDPEKAKALENDVRAKIIDMLADEEMTIEGIHEELQRRGEDKAETTVRHHVNVLKDAGMVEIARLEEAGGGTRKYYTNRIRGCSPTTSPRAATRHSARRRNTQPRSCEHYSSPSMRLMGTTSSWLPKK